MQILNRFDEVFSTEMAGWCYGLQRYPGQVSSGLVLSVVKQLRTSFRTAIEHHYAFDLLDLARQFHEAAQKSVPVRDIALAMMTVLPPVEELASQEQASVWRTIVRQVESVRHRASSDEHARRGKADAKRAA